MMSPTESSIITKLCILYKTVINKSVNSFIEKQKRRDFIMVVVFFHYKEGSFYFKNVFGLREYWETIDVRKGLSYLLSHSVCHDPS